MSARGSRPGQRRRVYEAIEALLRVSRAVERRRRQLARAAGLSVQQWAVLEEIGREDFLPSLFARGRETSPAAVSRTLRQLLDRGLVSVAIGANDARQREYSLTAPGRRVLEQLRGEREAALSTVWDGFPAAEVERFAHFSGALADGLEDYAARVEEDR